MLGWGPIPRTTPWETTALRGASMAHKVRHEGRSDGLCSFKGPPYWSGYWVAVLSGELGSVISSRLFSNTKNMNKFTVVVLWPSQFHR